MTTHNRSRSVDAGSFTAGMRAVFSFIHQHNYTVVHTYALQCVWQYEQDGYYYTGD